MEFITIECMNPNPHKTHTWHEGFLWHRKRKCGGVPKRKILTKEEWKARKAYLTHRHHYRFDPVQSDGGIMVWCCEKSGCHKTFTMFRSSFQWQTRITKVDMRYRLSLWP